MNLISTNAVVVVWLCNDLLLEEIYVISRIVSRCRYAPAVIMCVSTHPLLSKHNVTYCAAVNRPKRQRRGLGL